MLIYFSMGSVFVWFFPRLISIILDISSVCIVKNVLVSVVDVKFVLVSYVSEVVSPFMTFTKR